MFISGNTEPQEIIENEALSEESDDANPLHINYDSENLPTVEYESDIERKGGIPIKPKKSYLRDVRSSKRRRSK